MFRYIYWLSWQIQYLWTIYLQILRRQCCWGDTKGVTIIKVYCVWWVESPKSGGKKDDKNISKSVKGGGGWSPVKEMVLKKTFFSPSLMRKSDWLLRFFKRQDDAEVVFGAYYYLLGAWAVIMDMTRCQILQRTRCNLPAKVWRLVGCTKIVSR